MIQPASCVSLVRDRIRTGNNACLNESMDRIRKLSECDESYETKRQLATDSRNGDCNRCEKSVHRLHPTDRASDTTASRLCRILCTYFTLLLTALLRKNYEELDNWLHV